ncbi:MAG: hypothetical protein AB8G22_13525 [Saprospiraceae bacterium]
MKGQKLNLEALKTEFANEVIEQGLEYLKGGEMGQPKKKRKKR